VREQAYLFSAFNLYCIYPPMPINNKRSGGSAGVKGGGSSGTRFACFTSTKVQILTQNALKRFATASCREVGVTEIKARVYEALIYECMRP